MSRLRQIASRSAYAAIMGVAIAIVVGLHAAGVAEMIAAYGAVALAAGLIAILERVMPFDPHWHAGAAEQRTDLLYLVLVQMLWPMLLTALAVHLAARTAAAHWPAAGVWPHDWPIAAQAILMLAAADFLRYWLHRAFHALPLLWRFHAIHHGPTRLYWLNVARFHPLEKAGQFLFDATPFLLLGVGEPVIAAYFVFYAVNGFFQHANLDVRLGWLNWIVAGPELHRWHHARHIGTRAVNYGNNLILWDWLFGTRSLPRGRHVGALGISGSGAPSGLLAETLAPFQSPHEPERQP